MTDPPVVCDMTDAVDTPPERLALYERLFALGLVGRERTEAGVRWRFRRCPAVEELARELAARENACCAFMTNAVTVVGDELHWDATTIDDPAARGVLELFVELPDLAGVGVADLFTRFTEEPGVPLLRDGRVVTARVGSPTEDALEDEDPAAATLPRRSARASTTSGGAAGSQPG